MSVATAAVAQVTPDPETTLGDRLALSRRRVQLDQQDLATLIGVSRPLVSKWERGLSVPDVVQAAQWADITRVSFGWLAGVPASSRCTALGVSHLRTVPGGAQGNETLDDWADDVAARERRTHLAIVR